MIQAARQQPASAARTPAVDASPSSATPAVAMGRGALPAGLSGSGDPSSRWSLGAPTAAAEREAEVAAHRIGQGQRAGPVSAGSGDAEVRGDGATAAAGPVPEPAARALDGLSSGGGRPLSAPQMAFFGEAFSGPGQSPDAVQQSLAPVRVHTDTRAATVLEHTGAAAANVGANVMSRPSDYSPDRPDGGPHFPHEIAHALQPGGQAGDGVVRRIILNKDKAEVDPPKTPNSIKNVTKGQKTEIFKVYDKLLVDSEVYLFTKMKTSEIRASIKDFVVGGGKASDISDLVNLASVQVVYGENLASMGLFKRDRHRANFSDYIGHHVRRIQEVEAASVPGSTVLSDMISSEEADTEEETDQADSNDATGTDVAKLKARLDRYYTELNKVLSQAKKAPIENNVALPQYGGFNDDSNRMGASASVSINSQSSLMQGSSSKKGGDTRVAWEDYLDSRLFEHKLLYVRGHLLNANLSGVELALNLIPLTSNTPPLSASGNKLHSVQVEEGVKKAARDIFQQRELLDSGDTSLLQNRFSDFSYSVEAVYKVDASEPYDARDVLRTTALMGVLAAGEQVRDRVKGSVSAAAATAVKAPDPTKPDEVIDALDGDATPLNGYQNGRLNPALAALESPPKTPKDQYVALLENAGLWDYDCQNVPRAVKINRTARQYTFNDTTKKTEKTAERTLKPVVIENEVGTALQDYQYTPLNKGAELQARGEKALPSVVAKLGSSQGSATGKQTATSVASQPLNAASASPQQGMGGSPSNPHKPTHAPQPLANPSATSVSPVKQRTDFMSGLSPQPLMTPTLPPSTGGGQPQQPLPPVPSVSDLYQQMQQRAAQAQFLSMQAAAAANRFLQTMGTGAGSTPPIRQTPTPDMSLLGLPSLQPGGFPTGGSQTGGGAFAGFNFNGPPILPVLPQFIPPTQSTSSPPPKGAPISGGGYYGTGSTGGGTGQPQQPQPLLPGAYLQPQNSGPLPPTPVQMSGNINASPYYASSNSNVYSPSPLLVPQQPIASSANGGSSLQPGGWAASPYHQPQQSPPQLTLMALWAAQQKASPPPQTAAANNGPSSTQQLGGGSLQGQFQGNNNAGSTPTANPFGQQYSTSATGSGQPPQTFHSTPSAFSSAGSQADHSDSDSGAAATAANRKLAKKRKPEPDIADDEDEDEDAEATSFVEQRLYARERVLARWRLARKTGTQDEFNQEVERFLNALLQLEAYQAEPSPAKMSRLDGGLKKDTNHKRRDDGTDQ